MPLLEVESTPAGPDIETRFRIAVPHGKGGVFFILKAAVNAKTQRCKDVKEDRKMKRHPIFLSSIFLSSCLSAAPLQQVFSQHAKDYWIITLTVMPQWRRVGRVTPCAPSCPVATRRARSDAPYRHD